MHLETGHFAAFSRHLRQNSMQSGAFSCAICMKKPCFLYEKALLNAAFCRIMKQKRVTSTNLRLSISNKFEVVEHENVCYAVKKMRFRTKKADAKST